MPQPLVSIVIPVYNVEKYLKECLDSVLAQTLSSFEAICVNDGATDGSREILEGYARKDRRFVVIDQENAGLSAARNAGLKLASGKYVYFLDSDDMMRADLLEICVAKMEANDLDAVFFDGSSFYENEQLKNRFPHYETFYTKKADYGGVKPGRQLFIEMVSNREYRCHVSLYMAKRAVLNQFDIAFSEGMSFEDNAFTLQLMIQAQRTAHISETLFMRRVRSRSIMTSAVGLHQHQSLFYILKTMLEFAKKHAEDTDLADALAASLSAPQGQAASYYALADEPSRKELLASLSPLDRMLHRLMIGIPAELIQDIRDIRRSKSYRLASRLSAIHGLFFKS